MERVVKKILSPESAVARAENHVTPAGVRVDDDADGFGNPFEYDTDEFGFFGEALPVRDDTAQGFPAAVDPDVNMPHKALSGAFVVAGDAVARHPGAHGVGGTVGGGGLQEAVAHVDDFVTARAVEPDYAAGADRVLALIPVPFRGFRAQDGFDFDFRAAQTREGVLYALALRVER